MSANKKLLIIDVAALSKPIESLGMEFRYARSIFPALTSPVQGSFRTASQVGEHGIVANGMYFRQLGKVMFWEQSSRLVQGERIWSQFRRRGGSVAMLFWQQSFGEDVDVLLSPAPIHKHHGGMIEDCYSKPAGLYRRLCKIIGKPFKLRHYWGPMASEKSGEWISLATAAILQEEDLSPDLCFTYLPTLDYALQRHGPDSPAADKAHAALEEQLAYLLKVAQQQSYDVVIFGDYRIVPVSEAIFPNRILADADLFKTRSVKDKLYPDFLHSKAFAVVDHQIAHVYIQDESDIDAVRDIFLQLPGVADVMDVEAQREAGIFHRNSGELLLLAEAGTWFAYPWWKDDRNKPDYASHVDIHNKPGYDPCELFWGWPPGSVSRDTSKVRGSHGMAGDENKVVWSATIRFSRPIDTIPDLARAVRDWLEQ